MEEDAGIGLVKLVGRYKVTQSISVAANLNVADAIPNDTLPVEAVAERVGVDRKLFYRLLRFLASHGVFVEGPIGQFTSRAAQYWRKGWSEPAVVRHHGAGRFLRALHSPNRRSPREFEDGRRTRLW